MKVAGTSPFNHLKWRGVKYSLRCEFPMSRYWKTTKCNRKSDIHSGQMPAVKNHRKAGLMVWVWLSWKVKSCEASYKREVSTYDIYGKIPILLLNHVSKLYPLQTLLLTLTFKFTCFKVKCKFVFKSSAELILMLTLLCFTCTGR